MTQETKRECANNPSGDISFSPKWKMIKLKVRKTSLNCAKQRKKKELTRQTN